MNAPSEAVPSILIVDDDLRIQRVVSSFLRLEGYKAIAVGSGEEALSQCDLAVPALVILDIRLPGIDGLDTCRAMRARPDMETTPILLFSGHYGRPEVRAARVAGADRLIPKPFNLEGLKELIASFLSSPGQSSPSSV